MSTFENNNNNNETNEFWYDKNEFYAENGLAKAQKKDRKSHGKKALKQAEERQKKQDEYISQLPGKMQKLLLEAKVIKAVREYKAIKEDAELTKTGKIYKHFVNPVKNTSQNVFYDNDNYEEDEEEYDDEEYDDEDALRAKEYIEGLNMWKRYGLTKQQYDADLEHRSNIAALDAFNQDPENYLAPQYREMLEAKIKKFEDEMAAKEKAEEEALQDVNWYNPDDFDLDDPFEDWSSSSYPVEETLEDYAERMREQDMEFAMENARDDMRDDDDY
jgi:hypothetical protein